MVFIIALVTVLLQSLDIRYGIVFVVKHNNPLIKLDS